jgi:DNA-binding NarL/FixJ family response regulator
MTGPTIDCAIIDDEKFALDRLKDILNEFDALEIVGTHSSYRDAIENLLRSRPKVIFLDVELDKNHTAFELIDLLHANCYFPYIILITAFEHYSIKAIKKSVFDYLVKPIDIGELKETIARLKNQINTPYSTLVDDSINLSIREKQVLELVLEGKTSQEIADTLFVSKSTIDTHRKNILKKTGAKSISELMRLSRVSH